MSSRALEGSGDPGAAFLKNRSTHDDDQPQGGKEGEGGKRCDHCIILLESAKPDWA
jgi:hypothetical protein